jgi:hypothetical protein
VKEFKTMTDNMHEPEPEQIRKKCAGSLRAMNISNYFQAIYGCLLGEHATTLRLVELGVTQNGLLVGRFGGKSAFKASLCATEDPIKNIHELAPVAAFDGDEIMCLVTRAFEIKRQRKERGVDSLCCRRSLFCEEAH